MGEDGRCSCFLELPESSMKGLTSKRCTCRLLQRIDIRVRALG